MVEVCIGDRACLELHLRTGELRGHGGRTATQYAGEPVNLTLQGRFRAGRWLVGSASCWCRQVSAVDLGSVP
jgi:hypothetical protein